VFAQAEGGDTDKPPNGVLVGDPPARQRTTPTTAGAFAIDP